jgi:Zn-dependent protease
MFFSLLFSEPVLALAWVVAVLTAVTVHEFSHGLAAYLRGDKTAEAAGRLTLNPLSHIDIFGFLSFLLIGYGWAKPVPYNPYKLKNPRWDGILVAMAGPGSNLLLAFMASLFIRLFIGTEIFDSTNLLLVFLFLMIHLNLALLFFNLIPLPPLDGSKIWHAIFNTASNPRLAVLIESRGQMILLALIFLSFTGVNIFFFLDFFVRIATSLLIGGNSFHF